MSTFLYYVMGFTQPLLMPTTKSGNNDDNSTAQISQLIRKHIHLNNPNNNIILCIPPAENNSKQIEVLFISTKVKYSDAEWETSVVQSLVGVISVQASFSVDKHAALPCMDRIISKVLTANKPNQTIADFYLDAYRVATQGIMHPLDNRSWKMTKTNIRRLHKISKKLEKSIADETAKKEDIVSQIKVRHLASYHAQMLAESDPAKYCDLAIFMLSSHNADIEELESKEMDISCDIDELNCKFNNIIGVLKRQFEIQYSPSFSPSPYLNEKNDNNGSNLGDSDDDKKEREAEDDMMTMKKKQRR